MNINASLNLTSDGIALDVDPSAGTLVVQDREWGAFAPTLTRDEAAELRAELDRAIAEIDRKRLEARRYLVVWVKGVPWRMPPVANIDALVEWSHANPDAALMFRVEHDHIPRSDAPPPTQ